MMLHVRSRLIMIARSHSQRSARLTSFSSVVVQRSTRSTHNLQQQQEQQTGTNERHRDLTVFFDGACPLCTKEIGHYQRLLSPVHFDQNSDSLSLNQDFATSNSSGGHTVTSSIARNGYHQIHWHDISKGDIGNLSHHRVTLEQALKRMHVLEHDPSPPLSYSSNMSDNNNNSYITEVNATNQQKLQRHQLGEMKSGAHAFVAIWSRLPYYWILASIARRVPFSIPVMEFLYRYWSEARLSLMRRQGDNRRSNTKASPGKMTCTEDRCSVKI